jgi:four helix bundle protein
MTHQRVSSAERLRTEKLQERTFQFAKRVLDASPRRFADDQPSRSIWRQLLDSAPSASGNLDEADEAESDGDFIHKMKIVLKETKESRRWLRFIHRCKLANHDRLGSLEDEANQLSKIFATIIINTKRRVAEEKARKQK